MKRTSLVITSIALLITFPTQSYAATKTSVTKPKSAGRTVAAIPNTILSGTTPPSSAIGINGDFYIDVKNATIYGPKSKGKWLTPTSLRGLSGTNGVDGKNGTDAKNISNASTVAGPQGVQGEKGATGSIGATGSTGAQGPAGASGSGATGAKGDTGLTGSAGSSGTNGTNGTNGSAGAQGSIGLTGSIGPAGSTGAKGETGTVGSPGAPGLVGAKGETGTVGPSYSYFLNIPAWTLTTSTPATSSNSVEFGTIEANASYNFQIILDGTFAIANSSAIYFSMEVKSTSISSVVTSQAFISDVKGSMNGTQTRHYMFNIIGTIQTGANAARLIITATDIAGATGSTPLALTGKGILNLVGQIG